MNGPYWNVLCCNERRVPLRHVRAIPYQSLESFGSGTDFFRRTFARLKLYCGRLEVPRDCYVELPPVFSYDMRKICHPVSPWWAQAYIEHAAKMVAFILLEVYDSSRFCA